jgi:hypothetical protein
MKVTSRHISWEELGARIASGIPFVHRIPAPQAGMPAVDIRVSERGEELAMWIPTDGNGTLSVSPLAAVAIEVIPGQAGRIIEIRTRMPALFQEIYGFFVSVSDKIQLNNTDPFAAVAETLDAWRDLLKAQAVLSEEAQLGLRGELHFMRQLIGRIGDAALAAWTGPQRQPHDFRVGGSEFEVKTTRSVHHVHVVNGLHQLEPSPGRQLYIHSLRVAPAGAHAGTTLPQEIDQTRALLSPTGQLGLDRILRVHFGYGPERADWYPLRLQPAAPPRLVPVDASCPRITAQMLSSIPHADRLGDVRYRVNLEGLGHPEGSPAYDAILSLPLSQPPEQPETIYADDF